MSIHIFLQARLSSKRLPAKALLPIAGMPVVVLAAKRAGNHGRKVTVLTSDEQEDDLLVSSLQQVAIPFYRGPQDDVLGRFLAASKNFDEQAIIVRLTADNVMPDGALIEDALAASYLDLSRDDCPLWLKCGNLYDRLAAKDSIIE